MPQENAYREAHAVTRGPHCHFFGYYDKTPWDETGRYLLGIQTTFMDRPPRPGETAVLGRIDTQSGNLWIPFAQTRAWNWQQGTMLHWLGHTPDRALIHNDLRNGRLVSTARDLFTGEEREYPLPVYNVSRDGAQAVSLNFARVARTRPGYGYLGADDPTEGGLCPDDDGVYWMDLNTGEHRLILSLAQIAAIQPEESMRGAEHWFNHLLFNPSGTRFIFLHRWKNKERNAWRTRLFTAKPDGTEIRPLNLHGMTSHFDWRGDAHVLAWAHEPSIGNRFFLYEDLSDAKEVVGEGVLTADGHCSYSPDGRWILNDAYPGRDSRRALMLFDPAENRRIDIGRFLAPKALQGEIRCDLHPRWSRDGRKVCIDSAHEGARQMYVLDVGDLTRK